MCNILVHSPHPLREYRAIPHLDTYEGQDLDNADYDQMSPDARAAAERQLRKRDRREALASGRMRPGLLYDESDGEGEEEEGEEGRAGTSHRRRRVTDPGEGMELEEVGVAEVVVVVEGGGA